MRKKKSKFYHQLRAWHSYLVIGIVVILMAYLEKRIKWFYIAGAFFIILGLGEWIFNDLKNKKEEIKNGRIKKRR